MSRDTNFQNFSLRYSETTYQTTPVRKVSTKLGEVQFLMKISNKFYDFLTKKLKLPNLAETLRTEVI